MSGRPRLVVVEHAPLEGLGTLDAPFRDAAQIETLEAFGDPMTYRRTVDRVMSDGTMDALVLLGGPQSVYDHAVDEALEDSLRLARFALRAELPVLGICLGAQLIAWNLGAQVRPGRTLGLRKEIGWFPLDLTDRGRVDPLFHGFHSGDAVFHWHGDTFEMPEKAWPLASSPFYPNQAFRAGRWTYGLQFHLEVTQRMVSDWVAANAEELAPLTYVDPRVLVAQAPRHEARLERAARVAAEHFLAGVRESMAEKGLVVRPAAAEPTP